MNEDLPAVDYMVAYSRGRSVKCAPYASFGTPDLAVNALKTMGDQNAEQLEFCAELYVRAQTIGKPVILPDDEMDQMVERFMRAGY